MKKLKNYLASLEEEILVDKKTFLLEIMVTLLAGILLGILFSPKRSFAIASNNSIKKDICESDEDLDEDEE